MDKSKQPVLLSFRSSPAFITTVIAYAVFTDQFLFAVIIPVAPFALHDRLHLPEDRIQYWIALLLGVYGLGCFVWSPFWGWYSDRKASRRTPWLLGLLVLLAATILLWLAKSIALQLVARILQGLASTVIWTTGLAIMVDTVGDEHIGEYMGYIGISLNLGTLIAPLVGGLIFAHFGYNAVFFLMLCIIAVDIILRLGMVERQVAFQWLPVDTERILGSVDDKYTVVESAGNENKDEVLARLETISRSSSPDSVASSQDAKWQRCIPTMFKLLLSARFLSALWGTFVLAAVYSGLETVLPLVVHSKFGWSSTGGGLIFLPFMAPALLGPLVGRLSDRIGPRWIATGGFLLMSPSFVLLFLVQNNTTSQKVLLFGLLGSIGLSITLALEPLMAEITHVASRTGGNEAHGSGRRTRSSYAQAYAMFNMAWATGGTIGPLWAGLILESQGWREMSWSFGLLSGASVIPTVLLCGGWWWQKADDEEAL
ncbi:Hypothetical protein R9X50_00564200 [Acrodontium crateriforme]|uniref:Major facilitator superfamily (MFS) profile domain-containing protein n=1 Tax=Acrodontium crateriforme TaxID=150365 RepID=A0AAQ3R998_9PEZI|nr:Hypothetical protein R9X50_00564200 [Acrodontium crateriforme]